MTGATIWAYKPGKAIARAASSLSVTVSPPVVRLTLEEPVKRTIMVVGPDEKPVAGLRVVPRSLKSGRSTLPIAIPDDFLDRLTVMTDAKGEAALAYLPL